MYQPLGGLNMGLIFVELRSLRSLCQGWGLVPSLRESLFHASHLTSSISLVIFFWPEIEFMTYACHAGAYTTELNLWPFVGDLWQSLTCRPVTSACAFIFLCCPPWVPVSCSYGIRDPNLTTVWPRPNQWHLQQPHCQVRSYSKVYWALGLFFFI